MLYIEFQTARGTEEHEWHVGDRPPILTREFAAYATFVKADGHELEWVRSIFSSHGPGWECSIPIPRHTPVVVWYGDFAKQVADAVLAYRPPKGPR